MYCDNHNQAVIIILCDDYFSLFKKMLITENQREWCIKLMNYLYKWNLTMPFRAGLDPNQELYKEYKTKVENPIDLNKVKSELWAGNYQTIDNFLFDLKSVFENAKIFHGPGTVIYMMAEEILIYIKGQEQYKNMSEDERWIQELIQIQNRLEDHIKNRPIDFCQSLIPPR